MKQFTVLLSVLSSMSWTMWYSFILPANIQFGRYCEVLAFATQSRLYSTTHECLLFISPICFTAFEKISASEIGAENRNDLRRCRAIVPILQPAITTWIRYQLQQDSLNISLSRDSLTYPYVACRWENNKGDRSASAQEKSVYVGDIQEKYYEVLRTNVNSSMPILPCQFFQHESVFLIYKLITST